MRHEKALDLVVLILLAAFAAFVTVAVDYSQSGRNAALWESLAVASFLAAILVPVFWLGIRPALAWGYAKSAISTAKWRGITAQTRAAGAPFDADETPGKIDVFSAVWAGPNASANVTSAVRGLRTTDGRFSFVADNGALGEDPDVGHGKMLTIAYNFRGKIHRVIVNEGEVVNLP